MGKFGHNPPDKVLITLDEQRLAVRKAQARADKAEAERDGERRARQEATSEARKAWREKAVAEAERDHYKQQLEAVREWAEGLLSDADRAGIPRENFDPIGRYAAAVRVLSLLEQTGDSTPEEGKAE